MILWDRKDITYCKCPNLRYAHAHCPCEECNGKAVSCSTEYCHWMAFKEQLSIQQDRVIQDNGANTETAGEEVLMNISLVTKEKIELEPEMMQFSEAVTLNSLVPDDIITNDHEQDSFIETEHETSTVNTHIHNHSYICMCVSYS